MTFRVIGSGQSIPQRVPNVAYLSIDNWNDFGHQTSFYLSVLTNDGSEINIGEVKIGQFALPQDEMAHTIRSIPKTFETLDET